MADRDDNPDDREYRLNYSQSIAAPRHEKKGERPSWGDV